MLSGISWNANWSIEKFQNSVEVGEWSVDFFEYLFPRLLPNYIILGSAFFQSGQYSYPNVKASLHKHEWQTPLFLCHAYPYFTIHEQSVVEVYHSS